MLDKLDAALRFQQEALNLRAQRQEVLAANIAQCRYPWLSGSRYRFCQ
ncbi:flagellar basal-body rod protein FlgB [Escherichia coli]|uniref:Flagellar basal-body rod protein FlgB n=1 Tax=Escherichia coli TaxID=562 RepID=A0A376VL73_ECOLX|nr:flagellar basal-body rod protein FlgB [Escherichia coli]